MCEINVYLSDKGQETLILKDVDFIEAKNGKVHVRNIMGEEKTVDSVFKSISMREHKLILTRK